MTFEEIKQDEETYIMHTYGRFPIALDHGKGATLWDTDGKKYIDLTSGIGVNSLGHDNEALTTAVSEQAHKLMHACNLYYTEPMVQAAKKLVDAAGMGKIFFANSGAEANEGMIKLARKYSFDKYGEGRNKIITLKQSFHGRTVTTLKATGQDKFHQYFFPFTEGFDYAAANDIEDMKRKIDDTTCAVMMEMIQGEGGVLPLSKVRPSVSLKEKNTTGHWFIHFLQSSVFLEIANPSNICLLSLRISRKFARVLIPRDFPKRRGRVI